MKTAVLLTCLVAGGSLFYAPLPAALTGSAASVSATKSFPSPLARSRKATNALPIAPVRVVIDKSDYELSVYDSKGWYATYPVVFGNASLSDKKMEGDRNTPEGAFRIVSKRVHEKWSRFLAIDYPTKESLYKFNQRKQRGEIPKSARPGGAIGIHGTWPNDDVVVDRYQNWTQGCISLKNGDVLEIYSYIPVGTPVVIKK